MKADLNSFERDIQNAGTICVAGHQTPDGDSIGSCFAMCLTLELMGKKPILLMRDFPEKFGFLSGSEFIANENTSGLACDLFIALDCASAERLGFAREVFDRAKLTYSIDHHVSNSMFADHNFVMPNASSTCELIYDIISHISIINKPIAEALYTGMVFDTGGFRHNTTTQDTHATAARLLNLGIDFSAICRRTVYEHTLSEARAFGLAMSGLTVLPEIKLAYTCLSYQQMRSADLQPTDLEGVAQYMLDIQGIETSVLFSGRGENEIKASFRSQFIDVSKLAGKFGGGGHVNAAGASFSDSMENVVALVTDAVRSVFEKND